jgi:hypothetical protein
MNKEIKKEVEGNTLTVSVECEVRYFAKNPIISLTTDELVDILGEEYKIKEIISAPDHTVGNSNRGNMKTEGTWTFSLVNTQKENVTKMTTIEPKSAPVSAPTKKKNQPSIRRRISNISKKQNKTTQKAGKIEKQ